MPLHSQVKYQLYKNLENYEGRFNHLYLDTKGKVTVGVGHLVMNKTAMGSLVFYKLKNNLPVQMATLQEKQAEYDAIAKLPWGQRYGAATFKKHASMIMKDTDIDKLVDKHIDSFYKELSKTYSKANGYTDDFDNLHKNVQLALFDLIFNLGATKLANTFPNFYASLKTGDWKKAAPETNRPDVNAARNLYVKQLLLNVPTAAVTTP